MALAPYRYDAMALAPCRYDAMALAPVALLRPLEAAPAAVAAGARRQQGYLPYVSAGGLVERESGLPPLAGNGGAGACKT